LLIRCAGAAAFVMFVAECLRVFVGSNFHSVVPGRCYRAGQPTAQFLENVHRTHGIRTIINLRDKNETEPWYQAEELAANRLGLTLVNAGLSSKEQPPEEDFLRFVKAVKNAKDPVLIHCANGNDRTGLASAVYLMMHTDTPMAEARGQLGLRYGHIAWSKASCLSRILDGYENWLAETGKVHNADHFYYWAEHNYRPEVLWID